MGSVFLPLLAAPINKARNRFLLCRRGDRHRRDLELVESRSQNLTCHLEPLLGRADPPRICPKRLHRSKETRFLASIRPPDETDRLRVGS